MLSLCGLKYFMKSKKHSSPPHQQDMIAEEKPPTSRHEVQNPPVNHDKTRSAEATLEPGYGASSRQEIFSAHTNPTRKGSRSDQAPVTRKNFSAVKNVGQDEVFTNDEMLPGREKAYKQFRRLYPEYLNTYIIDEIRAREYADLDERGHVCFDYSGYGLFSKWQETWHKASSSFGLSYISQNLPSHALYGEADEGTAENDIKRKVSEFLNIEESEYAMVFTASRGSAFKLLGESYPFHTRKKLLSVYDHESDAVKWLGEAAQKRGSKIMSAKFRWPSQRLWATDLKNKIIEKQSNKMEAAKGLFVFPVQSRVTGGSYSYQWMLQAQENGWDILLDASALGPNVMGSLGLCVLRPDFVVSSFFKVYGSDPTGFGCLIIKRTVLQRLHTSSIARGVGMVRLVPTSVSPAEGQPKGRELQEPVYGSLRYTGTRRSSSKSTSGGSSNKFYVDQASSKTSKSLPETSGAGSNNVTPSISNRHDLVLTNLHRHKGSGASSSRPSKKSALEGVQSSMSRKLVGGLTYSSNNGKKVTELGQNDACHRQSQSNPEEGVEFADADRTSGPETGGRGSLQQECGELHVAMSPSVNGPKDFCFSDEEVDKNASSRMNKDNDDDTKAFDVVRKEEEIFCRGLQHAQELGLTMTNVRLRCLTNWLIASMLKLHHPGSTDAHRLVQIYGPKVSYDRGASVAFNLFDWEGNLLQPSLVRRLADRSNISLGVTTLKHIQVAKSSSSASKYLEHLNQMNLSQGQGHVHGSGEHLSENEATLVRKSPSIEVITISLCFLSNFQDAYRFWVFLANFLDADFVSKEVWLYHSLNQETVVMGDDDFCKSHFS